MKNLLAQTINNPTLGNLGNLNGAQFFDRLFPALVSLGLTIGAIAFLFMLIWGGVEWITSGGDKVRNEAARQRVTNALTGIVILFSVFAILNLVECFFGIGLRQIYVGPFQIGFGNGPVLSTCRPVGNIGPHP